MGLGGEGNSWGRSFGALETFWRGRPPRIGPRGRVGESISERMRGAGPDSIVGGGLGGRQRDD